MIARCLALALLLAAGTASAAAPPIYLLIDGHWYTIADGPRIFWYDGYGFYMPTATATGCARADGNSQVFGNPGLYLGQFFFPVYRIRWFSYRNLLQVPGYFVMEYKTEPGNIVCDNEIPSPIPDAIFKNGFDPGGSTPIPGETIFLNGFEARTL